MAILVGKREIKAHMRIGWEKILDLRRNEALPVEKMGGVWQSNSTLLDDWHRKRLETIISNRRVK